MPEKIIKNLKKVKAEFEESIEFDKNDLVRTNIDLHPVILKRLKIIAAYNDTDSKNLSQDILTSIALQYLPEL
jgi:hypothetical protein